MKHKTHSYLLLHLSLLSVLLIITSCHSSKHAVTVTEDRQSKSYLERRLSIDIDKSDDMSLLRESARWIGVPYAYGGLSMSGLDCSGLTTVIYNNVYNIRLHRRSIDQYKLDCKHIKRSQLKQGDLVFFATGKTKGLVSHVGLYLKRDLFIHTSSSRGVMVSNLNDSYWIRTYVGAGRVRR